VARTLADLEGGDEVQERHVAEAFELVDPDGPGPAPLPQAEELASDDEEG
jgi:hypothetical protein